MDNIRGIGVEGIGIYIPETFMYASEIAEKTGIPEDVISKKFGVIRKPIPGPGDTPSSMAVKASIDAIESSGVSPEEIDLVIWNGAQHKDYPCWLAGLKVAEEIGARKAWSFDMEAMCGSMMAGMDVAKSIMMARDDVNTVLLASGYRNVDLINLQNPATRFMLDLGAGGAAAVLRKGMNENLILASAFKGDGSFSEDCVVPVAGAAKWPMKPEDIDRYAFEMTNNVDDFKKRLSERTMPNFYAVIRESLQKSGYSEKDIDYLAILHFKRSAHLAVLEELGLSQEQTVYLENFGHLGQNDQLLSIKLGLEKGRIKDGSIVVLVGAGLGFVWAATTLKWGKAY
ncbi:MAG: 3-oxoacyl-(Acyl-carrier-protein) synthase III [Thermotogales bacterium 46_20]|nr:MAG: 3-oxoacyl-(Acyl-carrier-protein) synthase III [Thermotogales bacterium 46_20]